MSKQSDLDLYTTLLHTTLDITLANRWYFVIKRCKKGFGLSEIEGLSLLTCIETLIIKGSATSEDIVALVVLLPHLSEKLNPIKVHLEKGGEVDLAPLLLSEFEVFLEETDND